MFLPSRRRNELFHQPVTYKYITVHGMQFAYTLVVAMSGKPRASFLQIVNNFCPGGGGVTRTQNVLPTRVHQPIKWDPKWRIAPCYICTPKMALHLQNITLNVVF